MKSEVQEHVQDVAESIVDLRPIQAPRLTGSALAMFAKLTRCPGLGKALLMKIRKDNDFNHVREFASTLEVMPLYYPLQHPTPHQMVTHSELANKHNIIKCASSEKSPDFPNNFRRWTIQDYTDKYKSGETTPLAVTQSVLDAIEHSNAREPPLLAVISVNRDSALREAHASTERYKNGAPLSALDGIPIAVKDEIDVAGFPTTFGTSFLGDVSATEDAVPIARLRKAGVIFVGKTNMHEAGMGSFGINIHHGTPRNPYNQDHMTGGSSSGSAAIVAAGIVPLAIGCDGGGSIRIPSGLCGIVGLKATYMRIPCNLPVAPSMTNVGPMAATVQDAALAYAYMSGPDDGVPYSLCQPQPCLLPISTTATLSDLRVGVFREYVEGIDPKVEAAFASTVALLEQLGATIVDVQIPHLKVMHLSHAVTILTEISQHLEPQPIQEFAPDAQINLAIARNTLDSSDFFAAQKVRTYATQVIAEVFDKVDVFLTPTTAALAPRLERDVFKYGLSQLELMTALMRFVVIGNLVGIPGITVPVAFDGQTKLPISMQLQAKHWNEHIIFRVAEMLERHAPASEPEVHYSPLDSCSN